MLELKLYIQNIHCTGETSVPASFVTALGLLKTKKVEEHFWNAVNASSQNLRIVTTVYQHTITLISMMA